MKGEYYNQKQDANFRNNFCLIAGFTLIIISLFV